ncbi:short-chain dehydrogenase protein [Rutstroemia sp. NJR-2017a BBW]|nr:short-chain dehydrogenase protein [Rutstroemia sp. NJR-2017a BBW]
MNKFTPTQHHTLTPLTTPTNNPLPTPFVVAILGASSGIGEHLVYSFALAGASAIIISSRTPSDLSLVAQKARLLSPTTTICIHPVDISSSISVSSLATYIRTTFARLDILIPVAAYPGPVTLRVTEGNPEDFQKNFDVNTIGTYHCAHYLIPLLLESEGGRKGFFVIGSLAANLVDGPIANTGYCVKSLGGDGGRTVWGGGVGCCDGTSGGGGDANSDAEYAGGVFAFEDLCGGFCVWLSKNLEDLKWLNGRFLDARWDVEELVQKKDEVVEKDLLKWTLKTT